MATQPPRALMRLVWRFHRLVWHASGGRLGRRAAGMPVLELVTTGRKSGLERSLLISFVPTQDGPALAGTNVGAAVEPAWAKNLKVDPRARVRVSGEWRDVRARFLEGDEYDRVWDQFLEHRGYAEYRDMLDRHIPLVVLEDAGSG